MVSWNNLPKAATEDPFRPPDEPVRVRCLHCMQEYSSDEIVWCPEPDGPGFWRCPIEGCGGAGFGFDIHPLDSSLWSDDDDDDEPDAGEDWVE